MSFLNLSELARWVFVIGAGGTALGYALGRAAGAWRHESIKALRREIRELVESNERLDQSNRRLLASSRRLERELAKAAAHIATLEDQVADLRAGRDGHS